MQLSTTMEGFKIDKLADGYAPVTLRGYDSSLGTLKEYLTDFNVSQISEEKLKSFMHYLHTSYPPERKSGDLPPLATASFHRYWKAIRCFLKWANEEKLSG